MKSILTFIHLFVYTLCLSIPTVDTININKESNEFFCSSEKPTIHFFCLVTAKQKRSNYIEKFNTLVSKKEFQNLENLHINLVFFEVVDNKTKSTGLNAFFNNKDNKYIIQAFEVIFQNFDIKRLNSHMNRSDINKYYLMETIREKDLVKVKIANVFCGDVLADNIPQYKNFITQLLNPIYTEKEEIESLKDSLKIIKSHLDSINKKLQLLEELLIPSNKVIKPNEKDGNKNKPKNKDVINENE